MTSYVHLLDELQAIDVPKSGILSRTLHQDDHVKVVLFAFDAGQELSEHTATIPATLQFIRGEADLLLGADRIAAKPGSYVYMQPNLRHSVTAKTPVVMLLTLIKSPQSKA